MKVEDAIKGRRAVRRFDDKLISMNDMRKILEAGMWAPSGSNIQPWEFILVMDNNNIEKIKLVSPGLFGNPKALVTVCINKERAKKGGRLGEEFAKLDIAMASQNMMLMAYSLGIGSCPVVSFSKIALKEVLSIPGYVEPVLILMFGCPKNGQKLQNVNHSRRWFIMKDTEDFLNDSHFKLLSFLITSARGCIDEPQIYGSLRLLDAAEKVIDIMKENGNYNKKIEELEKMIDECMDVLMYDVDKYIEIMEDISKKLGEIIKGE